MTVDPVADPPRFTEGSDGAATATLVEAALSFSAEAEWAATAATASVDPPVQLRRHANVAATLSSGAEEGVEEWQRQRQTRLARVVSFEETEHPHHASRTTAGSLPPPGFSSVDSPPLPSSLPSSQLSVPPPPTGTSSPSSSPSTNTSVVTTTAPPPAVAAPLPSPESSSNPSSKKPDNSMREDTTSMESITTADIDTYIAALDRLISKSNNGSGGAPALEAVERACVRASRLARRLGKASRLDEAETLISVCLRVHTRVFGDDNGISSSSSSSSSSSNSNSNSNISSITVAGPHTTNPLRQKQQQQQCVLHRSHALVVRGEVRECAGDYARAVDDYARALSLQERVGAHKAARATALRVAAIRGHQSDYYHRALDMYARALAIKIDTLGERDPATAVTIVNIGAVYRQMGDYARALDYFTRALTIRAASLGQTHAETATCVDNVAEVYRLEGDYARALQYYQWALEIRLASLGEAAAPTADTVYNIALVHKHLQRYEESRVCFERAAAMFAVIYGEEHAETRDAELQASRVTQLLEKIRVGAPLHNLAVTVEASTSV